MTGFVEKWSKYQTKVDIAKKPQHFPAHPLNLPTASNLNWIKKYWDSFCLTGDRGPGYIPDLLTLNDNISNTELHTQVLFCFSWLHISPFIDCSGLKLQWEGRKILWKRKVGGKWSWEGS